MMLSCLSRPFNSPRDEVPLGFLHAWSAVLIAAVVCASTVVAGSGGTFDVRAMRAPVIVPFHPPAPERLMHLTDEDRVALWQPMASAIVDAAQNNPQRLITIEPVTNAWRFDLLHASARTRLLEEFGDTAAARFEEEMAAFMLGVIAMADREQEGIPLSVIGIPAEPGGLSEAGAQALNARFAPVTRRLNALTSTRTFILSGTLQDEFQRVRMQLTEATRLHEGRPIVFRMNGRWRIAVSPEASRADGALAHAEGSEQSDGPVTSSAQTHEQQFNSIGYAGSASMSWVPENEVDPQGAAPLQLARFRPALSAAGGDSIMVAGGGGGAAGDGGSGGGEGEAGIGGGDPDSAEPSESEVAEYNPWENLHDFTGFPMTVDGWTDLLALYQGPTLRLADQRSEDLPYANSRIIYVSSSTGSDVTGVTYTAGNLYVGRDPFNPANPEAILPYQSLQAGYARLRNGFPDLLLLRRGDVWEESFTHSSAGNWRKDGRSPMEPMILAAYGNHPDRPKLLLGSGDGINASGVQNLIVSGIHFHTHTWASADRGKGLDILSSGSGARHQLHEDCVYERNDIIRVQGSTTNQHQSIAFRRCIFDRINDQSLYATRTDGLLIEECLFHSSDPKRRRHLYLSPAGNDDSSTLRGVVVRGNIFFDGRSTGLSVRSGGLIEGNLIVRNDIILVGGWGGSEDSIQSASIRNNVFLESSIGQGDGQRSIMLVNIDGGEVAGNIWTDDTNLGSSSYAMVFSGTDNLQIARNISITKNIVYGWSGSGSARVLRYPGGFGVTNVSITENDFQMVNGSTEIIQHLGGSFAGFTYGGNRYYSDSAPGSWFSPGGSLSQWSALSGEDDAEAILVEYPDPSRNLRTYNQLLGGAGSTEAFMAEALLQSRTFWRPEYSAAHVNAYIREGFAVDPNGWGK